MLGAHILIPAAKSSFSSTLLPGAGQADHWRVLAVLSDFDWRGMPRCLVQILPRSRGEWEGERDPSQESWLAVVQS
jgi:hypothetical protein